MKDVIYKKLKNLLILFLSSFFIVLWTFCTSPSEDTEISQNKDTPLKIQIDGSKWKRPRFHERQKERNRMVSSQIENGPIPIREESVLHAMKRVPRHLFVPDAYQSAAYDDRPLPIGYGQTISQPFIVAYMTEELELTPGKKVLEIGTGSGYQAAVLSELTPYVYTIEIIKELGEMAKRRLKNLGYKTVEVKIDDGYYGWKEYAPFDAIIVTAAAGHVPPPLLEQLKPGGRIVIPVGGVYEVQILMIITKDSQGSLKTKQMIPVRFVPMTGKVQK